MLYTPKYCSECGNEIENSSGKILSSWFCENCEINFKWQKFFPLIGLGVCLLVVIYGFGTYLKKPDKPLNLVTTSNSETASKENRDVQNQSNVQISAKSNVQRPLQETVGQSNSLSVSTETTRKPLTIRQNVDNEKQNSATETVYICGAQTKKGTACQRRVKGGGRCWQHEGQPAILPPDKLVISQ